MNNMEIFEKLQSFYIFAVLAFPGIIIVYFRSLFGDGRPSKISENIIPAITVGSAYTFIVVLPSWYFSQNILRKSYPEGYYIFAFLFSLILPSFLGFVLGLSAKKSIFRIFLSRLGINSVHPIPTAWEYLFSCVLNEGCLVEITLVDNNVIRGFYGTKSFSSSNPNERDIYLEKVCARQIDGSWKDVDYSNGYYVQFSHVKSLEFFLGAGAYEEDPNRDWCTETE